MSLWVGIAYSLVCFPVIIKQALNKHIEYQLRNLKGEVRTCVVNCVGMAFAGQTLERIAAARVSLQRFFFLSGQGAPS